MRLKVSYEDQRGDITVVRVECEGRGGVRAPCCGSTTPGAI
ncbi:hypothetical protein [Streptomyces sp. NBC_00233]|nr:hypothetical protein [Streptomyces sp. NBC_00233]MCX5232585.1 hypothetical protein [Streptomyces sp. NBC_00233]